MKIMRFIPGQNLIWTKVTSYTSAWFDVTQEPCIFSVPDMGDRYYLLPFPSGWTDMCFRSPAKEQLAVRPQVYAITGPGWSGKLPDGITEYKSHTGLVWLLGRIYCTGTPEHYNPVHALQDKFSPVPLSSYGKPYTPVPGWTTTSI
jgi:hypothetical protein